MTTPIIQGLYAITSEQLMPGKQLRGKVEAVLSGGCQLIQYRNKNSDSEQQREDVIVLRELCTQFKARLIVNDNVELALACNADGVHLGQTDRSLIEAREQANHLIIGSTCHSSLELAEKAKAENANYIAFGRFFSSKTKPDAPPANLTLIDKAKQIINLPVVAIGGITGDNAELLISAGADCIAVSYELFKGDDLTVIENRARQFQTLFT